MLNSSIVEAPSVREVAGILIIKTSFTLFFPHRVVKAQQDDPSTVSKKNYEPLSLGCYYKMVPFNRTIYSLFINQSKHNNLGCNYSLFSTTRSPSSGQTLWLYSSILPPLSFLKLLSLSENFGREPHFNARTRLRIRRMIYILNL